MAELLRGRYEPLEVVGEGGEGRVVKALDRQHDRIVALKIRKAGSGSEREALLSEARVLLAIPPHPHVPLVRDDFFDGDQYVIAMDWVEGTDLNRMLLTRGRPGLAPSLVLGWLADAAAALTHLHAQHPPVVHGDVKPANLVLTGTGRVVLVDFGLSSSPDSPRRRGGTRGFAAPELVTGQPGRASDVYSLAATAFALLTGAPPAGIRPPWDGVDPDQAAELEDAIRLGLATDPARRPESAGELVELLRAGWQATLPTGVLTFCLTDIVGSTSKWETRAGDMARSLAVHDDLVAAAAARHGGRFLEAQGEGDSTVTMFPAPGAAVSAAIDVVTGLASASWPGDLALAVRVGIHTGETDRRRGDYVGATLNLAARLRGVGDAGEILLSQVTAGLVRNHLPDGVSLVPLGPHRLRGVRDPEDVFAVAAPGVRTPPPNAECPYPGLVSFSTEDADRFFGREEVAADAVTRLRLHPFLAIVGASGSGKSSLLRAAIAPVLGIVSVITPGPEPLRALDAVNGPVAVDQFEELFSQCDDEQQRAAFLDRLLAWPDLVVIGLRADFYGACAEHPALAAAVERHQVLLGPMTPAELRRAISEPARQAGLRLEPGLVDVLVGEVAGAPGALPLLSHALRSTWEVRDGRTLTVEGYTSTGGVEGAIAATADRAVDALDPADQALARRLFVRLVEPGEGAPDTRRRVRLSELLPANGNDRRAATVLDAVVAARLVTMGDTSVEVAHEALIREWPRLRAWLDEDREGLAVQRHLTTAATAWEDRDRDPSELYRGPRLTAALDWREGDPAISAIERAFLDESRAAQERSADEQARTNRRLRRRLTVTAVVLVVALVAGASAFVQGRRAASARDRAEVSRVAAVSRSLTERQPDVGLLLAAEAFTRRDDADTRSTLLAAVETHPLLTGLLYGVESGLEAVVFTPDGKLLVTPTSDGTGTLLWDTATRKRIAVLKYKEDILLGAAVSPDGRWLVVPAVWETDDDVGGRLQVWDLSTRSLERVVPSPAGGLTSAFFSADGKRLVTQGGLLGTPNIRTSAVVWDTTSWRPVGAPWMLDDEYVDDRIITVSPDGKRLATISSDRRSVRVWSVDDRRPLGQPLRPAVGLISTLAFSPDGTLAVAGQEGRAVLVDPASGAEQPALRLPDGEPEAAEFSRDGRMLAVANSGGQTQLFDVASRRELGPPLEATSSGLNDVSFSADGSQLATGGLDRTGALWRLDGGRAIAATFSDHRAAVTEVAYTPDGRFLVSSGLDGAVTIRDLTRHTTRSIEIGGEVLSVAIDRTGRQVAVAGTTGQVQLFDVRTGRPGPVLDLGDVWVHQVAFDPTSGAVAAAVENRSDTITRDTDFGYVVVWDPSKDREIGPRARSRGGSPIGVAWSPDGSLVAVTFDNNLVRFYAADDDHAEVGQPIENVDATITAAAFAPDGTRLATATLAGIVQQWSVATHRPLGTALRGHRGGVAGVAYSPDGSMLASTTLGFSTTRLWDAETGDPIGRELVGGRTPFTFTTFDIEHYQGSRPAFSPDGRKLATPTFDGTTSIWDLEPASWLRAACAVAGRDLTRTEWEQHFGDRPYRPSCGPAARSGG